MLTLIGDSGEPRRARLRFCPTGFDGVSLRIAVQPMGHQKNNRSGSLVDLITLGLDGNSICDIMSSPASRPYSFGNLCATKPARTFGWVDLVDLGPADQPHRFVFAYSLALSSRSKRALRLRRHDD